MSITLSMSVTYMTSLSWLNITLTAGVSNAFRFVTKYIQGATQEMSQHVRPIPPYNGPRGRFFFKKKKVKKIPVLP